MSGWLVFLLLGLASAQIDQPDYTWEDWTSLDEYCKRDDGVYGWGPDPVDVFEEPGVTLYTYTMTSQIWMDDNYSDRTVWVHYLVVAIPNNPTITDAAHLWIEAGNNNENPPTMTNGRMQYLRDFAQQTGAVAAMVRQNPNQPVTFFDTPDQSLTEDAIIARTWRHYIEWPGDEPNSDCIFQNPMTKAAYRAVDALIEISNVHNSDLVIDKIYPSGISKRGWIAWLLAAIDERVFATAPVVLSLLNWNDNLHHHNENLGGWSWAFQPYWNENVSGYIDHPRSHEIFSTHAIDAFSYNTRMENLPKLMQVATGDQFFLIDDSHDFWDELKGENNYMVMWENADHVMAGHGDRMNRNLISFFLTAYYDYDWPVIRWEREVEEGEYGTLRCWVSASNLLTANNWWADNQDRHCDNPSTIGPAENEDCRRDFRQRTDQGATGINWETQDFDVVEVQGDEIYYEKTMSFRDGPGYRGFFFSFSFDGYEDRVIEATTDVVIMSMEFPWPRCEGFEDCLGVIK